MSARVRVSGDGSRFLGNDSRKPRNREPSPMSPMSCTKGNGRPGVRYRGCLSIDSVLEHTADHHLDLERVGLHLELAHVELLEVAAHTRVAAQRSLERGQDRLARRPGLIAEIPARLGSQLL